MIGRIILTRLPRSQLFISYIIAPKILIQFIAMNKKTCSLTHVIIYLTKLVEFQRALICKNHFEDNDIIIGPSGAKKLRVGVATGKILPKGLTSVYATPKRKPLTQRENPPPKKI